MAYTFRARQRIRRRPEFQRIYDQGRRVHGRLLTLFYLPSPLAAGRLGIAASRKLGGAVQRNLAKRWIREVFRHHPPGPGTDIVVIPRPAIFDADYGAIEAEYRVLLGRVHRDPSRRVARHDR